MAYKENIYDELIAKLLAGEITPAEKEDLMAWTKVSDANREYYDSLVSLWEKAEAPEETFFENELNTAWLEVEKQTQPASQSGGARIRPFHGRTFQLRVAAVLLIGLAMSWWYLTRTGPAPELIQFATLDGEQLEILLPDSSRVYLNENSTLQYAASFSQREVQLTGEGFFEITKQNGATFEIFSGDAVTTVLGTSFYVRAYPEEERVQVKVVTGKVALAQKDQESEPLYLEAGDAGVLKATAPQAVPEEVTDINEVAWHTQELLFEDQQLMEILPVLEDYYGVEIELVNPELASCHYTGAFKAKPIEEVLNILSFTLRMEVDADTTVYRLNGEGCQ